MRTASEPLSQKSTGPDKASPDKASPDKTSPALPESEGELAARLRLAVLRLSRQLRQQLVGGVTQSQVSVLSSVERLGSPTLGELAASEKVQPPSMTRQVDALV